MIRKSLRHYAAFIGVYILIYVIGYLIPIEIDLVITMCLGLVAMISIFIYLRNRYDFDQWRFTLINLIFTITLSAVTLLYEQAYGLTNFVRQEEVVSIKNSSFYNYTLSLNHAVIISCLVLLINSFVTRKIKLILISIISLAILAIYFVLIV